MSKVIPGVPVFAVVFAHGAPLPFTQIRTPFLPRLFLRTGFIQSEVFFCHRLIPRWHSPETGQQVCAGKAEAHYFSILPRPQQREMKTDAPNRTSSPACEFLSALSR